ncbi:MAG: CehA/McbA family metallohydrolase [Thermodesulfobacteriota bacterium]
MKARVHEYVANLHVHTTFSDGTGSLAEVIAAARETLDVLLINDHDTLAGRENGYEGYHGRLLVLVGLELSGPHNHYLAFGLEECPDYAWRNPQGFIDSVRSKGGIGFIAHPFEKGSPLSEDGQAFTWTDWRVNGFDGLEIWNHSSTWKTKARNRPTGLLHYYLNSWTLAGPDQETLDKWDELGRTRRVAGVGGSDAHAFKGRAGPIKFCVFPYRHTFRSINTHLLLPEPLGGDLARDRTMVLRALAAGSCFVAHDRLRRSEGFSFRLEKDGLGRAGPGQEVILEKGDALVWRLPARAWVRVLKNGRMIWQDKAERGRVEVFSPGVYRLEAYWPLRFFGRRPWIYSNPIYLRASDGQ